MTYIARQRTEKELHYGWGVFSDAAGWVPILFPDEEEATKAAIVLNGDEGEQPESFRQPP